MHARTCGLADHFAVDEPDALRTGPPRGRPPQLAQGARRPGPTPSRRCSTPRTCSASSRATCKAPFDPREVIARDRRRLRLRRVQAAVRAEPGHRLGRACTATRSASWPTPRGCCSARSRRRRRSSSSSPTSATSRCSSSHNTTGYMVGREYEQGGIIKHGAMMINAVSNSTRPAPVRPDGRVLRRRPLRHVRPRATSPGSCSPGPAPSPR